MSNTRRGDIVEDESFSQVVKTNKSGRKKRLVFWINLLLLIALGVLGYAYYESAKEIEVLKGSNSVDAEAMKKDAKETEELLSKLVILPTSGEEPQILIVNDAKAAVAEQPALAGVVNGDKVLLYVKSQKAYVYSPSRNKLVNILPLFLGDDSATKQVKDTTAEDDSDE